MAMNRIFDFDFGFEFVEIFVIENRLPDLVSRGVVDSPYRWVGESAIEQLLDPLKQRHHKRQQFFDNIFFQCLISDWANQATSAVI